jgi:ribosomal protein S18 acetylase RimI-like enzyme
MDNIVIRKAELKDVTTIADFNVKIAEESEGKSLDRENVRKGVKAVITDCHKGFYLVAEKSCGIIELVGQLLITFEWSDWRNGCFWWVQSVYVPKKYRNQRIFSQLFRYIIELAKRSGDVSGMRLYVEKHNEAAKRIYEALGMKKTSYDIYEVEF